MRRTLQGVWFALVILFLLACGGRIALGYPIQGIIGAVFGVLLLPPVFNRVKSWKHPFGTAIWLMLGAALIVSPLPRKISYKSIWNSLSGDNSTTVELSVTATPTNATSMVREVTPTSAAATATVTVTPMITSAPIATITPVPTNTPVPTDTPIPTDTPTPTPEPSLQVICLDVGQGDATLLLHTDQNGVSHAMMIDGGDRGTSSFVVARLKRLGVTRLDAIVATHYDADHVFGLIGCYTQYADKDTTVYCPAYTADTSTYIKFRQRLDEGIVTVNHPKPGDAVPFGDCEILVLGPVDENDPVENNRSIVLYITYEGISFYWPGDAEKEEEAAIVAGGLLPVTKVDVYHASHHGSYSASTKSLLDILHPTYTVISVGADNPYQHPHDVVLRRLAGCGCENIFRTDEHGEITFLVKGGVLSISTEK